MGSLVLAGASSGSTTITPTDAVTATVTLPSTGGTLQTSGSGYTANGVAYASSTSALATGSTFVWTGSALGIGTSSPSSQDSSLVSIVGSKSLSSGIPQNQLNIGDSSGLTTGAGGAIGFSAYYTGTSFTTMGSIEGVRENATSGNYAGALVFKTRVNGGSNNERMRLDSSGSLSVGVTGSSAYHRFFVNNLDDWTTKFANTNSSSPYGITIQYDNASPNGTVNNFWNCQDSTTTRGKFVSNGGLYNYSGNNQNLSDRREKTNFAPATSYLDKICAIPVQTFNYIDQNLEEDGGLTLGVVAQDVQAIAPELVTESNWGSEDEPKMRLSIYQTDLQYALMKSIQELSALVTAQSATITSLTERITALENK